MAIAAGAGCVPSLLSALSSRSRPSALAVPSALPPRRLKASIQAMGSAPSSSASTSGSESASSTAGALSVVDEEDPSFWERVQAHQKEAARLPPVEEARTLLERCCRGILSTASQKYGGYPVGSSVALASEPSGSPLLAVSSLSAHTGDLLAQPMCSILLSRDFSVPAEPVLTLVGDAQPIEGEEEVKAAREAYLKRHPGAFWVDFGDFRFIRIKPKAVRLTANIATFAIGASVSEFTGEEFCSASPDPIAPAEGPVAAHMNADHEDALVAIAQDSLAVKIPGAKMLTLDRFGFTLEVPFKDQASRIRIPFPREAAGRKDVKDLLVEMTKAAKSKAP